MSHVLIIMRSKIVAVKTFSELNDNMNGVGTLNRVYSIALAVVKNQDDKRNKSFKQKYKKKTQLHASRCVRDCLNTTNKL